MGGFNDHLAIMFSNGDVYTVGANQYGNLGNNTTSSGATTTYQLANPSFGTGSFYVSCGEGYTGIVTVDNLVGSCGIGTSFQTVQNNTTENHIFTQCIDPTLSNITNGFKVSCGYQHTSVLLLDGRVILCGSNQGKQLGLDNSITTSTPVYATYADSTVINTAIDISCGRSHTSILLSNTNVITMGLGSALGIGDYGFKIGPKLIIDQNNVPISGINRISCGYDSTYLLSSNGDVFVCGSNTQGELATGAIDPSFYPQKIPDVYNAVSVSCGYLHGGIVINNGTVFTCGINNVGQVGTGNIDYKNYPYRIRNIDNAIGISCGKSHTAVLLSNGNVAVMGDNTFGQLGDGTTTTAYASILTNVSGVLTINDVD